MCVSSIGTMLPQIRSDSRFDMTTAGIVFFHIIAHPPQPRVSVDVGVRWLSQTAVYVTCSLG